ncbi:MAG: type II secretion system F family protein [Acidimicrobiia bacterium]|nr:type II secretion system F family protein [Acidimicrobiia bacterium]
MTGIALASLASAWFAAALTRVLIPPTRRLGGRLRPYLGAGAPRGAVADSTVGSVFGPILESASGAIGRILDKGGDDAIALRLRQAGWDDQFPEGSAAMAFRMSQLRALTVWTAGSVALTVMLSMGFRQAAVVIVAGIVIGATRQKGALERSIADRRERMRIEIYTVNQLLAMRIRAGGGVIQAVQRLVDRGRGPVIVELAEALRLHRSGVGASDAFRRVASTTPEPSCARTYALLAIAEDRGVDLAGALLSLSEDVREARREALRRIATRRRAAMLVPTIAILAPVMLLFVGAPLPRLVLGWQ